MPNKFKEITAAEFVESESKKHRIVEAFNLPVDFEALIPKIGELLESKWLGALRQPTNTIINAIDNSAVGNGSPMVRQMLKKIVETDPIALRRLQGAVGKQNLKTIDWSGLLDKLRPVEQQGGLWGKVKGYGSPFGNLTRSVGNEIYHVNSESILNNYKIQMVSSNLNNPPELMTLGEWLKNKPPGEVDFTASSTKDAISALANYRKDATNAQIAARLMNYGTKAGLAALAYRVFFSQSGIVSPLSPVNESSPSSLDDFTPGTPSSQPAQSTQSVPAVRPTSLPDPFAGYNPQLNTDTINAFQNFNPYAKTIRKFQKVAQNTIFNQSDDTADIQPFNNQSKNSPVEGPNESNPDIQQMFAGINLPDPNALLQTIQSILTQVSDPNMAAKDMKNIIAPYTKDVEQFMNVISQLKLGEGGNTIGTAGNLNQYVPGVH